MLVLGLQGSPRQKGNSAFMLDAFMQAAASRGARTQIVSICKKDIQPCKELIVCEKKGYCPIDDDMKRELYPLLRRAEIIVPATPIFFYNATAQLKALVDRCQTLWARKYRLKLADPCSQTRRGMVLSVAATAGKDLFTGLDLTMKYFFDAIDARFQDRLYYRKIEHAGDMQKHPSVLKDIDERVENLLKPFEGRKKILFLGAADACRSQMAAGLTQSRAGTQIEAVSCGTEPAPALEKAVVTVMAEKGVDMYFSRPRTVTEVLEEVSPDLIIRMDSESETPELPDTPQKVWKLARPETGDIEAFRDLRDAVEKEVAALIETL